MWRTHRTSIAIVISFVIMMSGFWLFPSLSYIFFISLLWTLLLKVPANKLQTILHFSNGITAAITLGTFIFLVGLLFTLVSKSLIPSLEAFIIDLPNITTRITQLSFLNNSVLWGKEFNALWSDIASVGVNALKSSLGILFSIFNKFIDFVVIIFVTFYLLKDGTKIKKWIASLFPETDFERLQALQNDILTSLHIYICSQLTICLLTATVVFTYFEVCNLPYSSVFAVLSGIAEFIPVLGPTVASCFGIILTATISPFTAVQTALFYLVLTQVNHNVVYPAIIGKGLNLHSLAIILGIIFGGELLAAPGMFLAVPCMVIIRHIIIDICNDIKSKE